MDINVYIIAAVGIGLVCLLFWKLQEKLFNHLLKMQESVSMSQHEQSARLQTSLRENLTHSTNQLSEQFDKLNKNTHDQLVKISEAVEVKLSKGFEKTNETFINIIQRLAIIDDAQKKITDLSQNVVSLQEIFADKRARGAFGEVQLHALIQNMLPEKNYHLQYTLSNNARVDCLLLLPKPTGNVAIDSKFPLENYQKYVNPHNPDNIQQAAKQQFKVDIKKHIQAISEKYIIPGETSDGAIMFIPAEAVFAEIHAHHPDLIEYSFKAKVWLASPSTMMAILTTASAVLKDSATREQVHVIQQHLQMLAKDFARFEKRMDNLSRHLQQANVDVEQVHTSAQKITKRFTQIEQVDLSALSDEQSTTPQNPLLEEN